VFVFIALPLPLMRGQRSCVLSFECYVDMATRVRVRGSSTSGGRRSGVEGVRV
jgi:hypothetical protein